MAIILSKTKTRAHNATEAIKRVLARREPKTRRRELRLTASADDVIAYAMAISGLTAGDMAYEGARRILEDHERRNRMARDEGASKPGRLQRRRP